MPLELENVKSLLPPGITLLPGETIEFIDRTSAIKLSKETSDGGFVECGYDTDEFYGQRDIANEVNYFVNPDVLENVFAFHMGESYISQSNDDDDSNSTGKKNIIHKNSKKKSSKRRKNHGKSITVDKLEEKLLSALFSKSNGDGDNDSRSNSFE
ncbi:7493_t:CDS:2 [Entrophospora sp. SA101]|nr:7493_t:CDS:2 [Entrophospora sp. SA101]